MRRLVTVLSLALLGLSVGAGAFVAPASGATNPPPSANHAGQWLARQINGQGFVPQAADPNAPNLSATAQAVIALAAAGNPKFEEVVAYLGAHVNDFVVSNGNDDPGALAYLILDAVIDSKDPRNFGTANTDLVARLQATKQPSGLFGANDPSFDGTFRQGLALMALKAVGLTDDAAADWLVGQQCADGLWSAFRADTATPCPAVDPANFTGPDTNSTALAILGLHAQSRDAAAASGVNALDTVRNAGGGWGFLARSDQATDANSTGLVLTALMAATGTQDQPGTAALVALQADCNADVADVGGVAFQDLSSGPDVLATVQATPALAGAVLPLGPVTSVAAPLDCPQPQGPPPTDVAATAPTTTPPAPVAGQPLARTGSWSALEVGTALALVVIGVVLVQRAGTRRRRHG